MTSKQLLNTSEQKVKALQSLVKYQRFIINYSRSGFTLIEILVVMSVISIVASVGVASYVSYSKTAVLKQGTAEVASVLRDAKARTQSQVKPSTCSGTLEGYQVDICGLTGSACATQNTYTLSIICSGVKTVLITQKLPVNVNFSQTGTTSVSYKFLVVSNGVAGAGDTALTSSGLTSAVTVSQSGSVSTQ